HKLFRRSGYDLNLDMKLPFTIAALGGEIKVPTLTGSVKYTVPEGTQAGTVFRLRGQGIQRLRGSGKGDLLVRVDIEVPKRMNEQQKTLLKAFGDSLGKQQAEAKQGKRNIFNIVKDALNND
ncbi:MAG TPA: DnaJ C-terminal domain-containing protein, partial [Clostridia bacterium]|nr:DnaJ C-terminal domain-containing protein [Clostridia bacterium]